MHTALQKKNPRWPISGLFIHFLLGLFLVTIPIPTLAQSPSFNGSRLEQVQRPSDQPLDLPAFVPQKKVEDFVLPRIKKPLQSERKLSNSPRLRVNKIHLQGNTKFSEKDLKELIEPYEGREITAEELQVLRHTLTLFYVERGYINSGVIIPDQKIKQGEITLQVIEGRLGQILISGADRLEEAYIRDRLMLGIETPLHVHTLQNRLQLLRQNPLIQSIQAELGPGSQLGEARLTTHINENQPWQASIKVDNRRSPSVGAENISLYLAHRNLSGWADTLEARLGLTKGLQDGFIAYQRPINALDTQFKIRYEQSSSDVVESPFDQLDIESESSTFVIGLQHPLINTPNHSFTLGFRLEIRHSETALLGRPFSFSAGVQNGESDVTVLRLSQEWLSRDAKQVIAFRSLFSFGLNAVGATINRKAPDGRFQAWLGQFQWARRLTWRNAQIIFRMDGQYTDDPLLPLEKFAVGGANSVRGYRENQLVRDHGLASALEIRIPLFPKKTGGSSWQLAPFVDYGWSKNRENSPNPRTLASAGLGVRWDPSIHIHAQLYWAYAFRNVENNNHDLQDDGIHLLASYQFF